MLVCHPTMISEVVTPLQKTSMDAKIYVLLEPKDHLSMPYTVNLDAIDSTIIGGESFYRPL